jgi:hypothetical protein
MVTWRIVDDDVECLHVERNPTMTCSGSHLYKFYRYLVGTLCSLPLLRVRCNFTLRKKTSYGSISFEARNVKSCSKISKIYMLSSTTTYHWLVHAQREKKLNLSQASQNDRNGKNLSGSQVLCLFLLFPFSQNTSVALWKLYCVT